MSGAENTHPRKKNDGHDSKVVLAYKAPTAVVVHAVATNNTALRVQLRFLIVLLPHPLAQLKVSRQLDAARARVACVIYMNLIRQFNVCTDAPDNAGRFQNCQQSLAGVPVSPEVDWQHLPVIVKAFLMLQRVQYHDDLLMEEVQPLA